MSFNIVQFFENVFHIGKTSPTPSALQEGVNIAGKALDDAEVVVNTLQGVAPSLPTPFQGYLAAIALAVHEADAYVDTIETQPATATPPAEPPKTA